MYLQNTCIKQKKIKMTNIDRHFLVIETRYKIHIYKIMKLHTNYIFSGDKPDNIVMLFPILTLS